MRTEATAALPDHVQLGQIVSDRPGRIIRAVFEHPLVDVTWSSYQPGERGPDLHVHRSHFDTFLVLDGELQFRLGTEARRVRAPAGTFVLVPPEVAHAFENAGETPAEWLNVHAPSRGFLAYLRGELDDFDQHEPSRGRRAQQRGRDRPLDGNALGAMTSSQPRSPRNDVKRRTTNRMYAQSGRKEIPVDKITPHLWFDREAVEAAELYSSTFPSSRVSDVSTLHDTPSGDCDVVSFELFGQPFMAISAGPLFTFTPAVSFLVRCRSTEEVDELWNRLSEGGAALMPLDSYPFSERYGWTEDRFGLSWQLMYAGGEDIRQRIVPTLMFVGEVCGKAEEAITFYRSVFPDSELGHILRYAEDEAPDQEGTIKHAGFTLAGQEFAAMDSARAHSFGFNEAVSFMVGCETQEEIDYYWDSLSAVPEAEQCGWLRDTFGVSWQVVPSILGELLGSGTKEQQARVTESFLQMKKFDIAELQRAYDGAEARVGGEA